MIKTRPTAEEPAIAPEPPPTWDEIAGDPEFQKKPADRQLIIFDRWTADVLPHISKQPDWNDQQTTFLTKTEDMRRKLSEAAGGLTPDQARVKLAREALQAAKPDGNFTPDEERIYLKPLGMDVATAFYNDRAGVNKSLPDIAPSVVDKALVPIGAGFANAPGAAMGMLEYIEQFLGKIPDAITGSKRSEAAAGRLAKIGEQANERRAIATEASGDTWGSIGIIIGEQLPMLPVQLATGGLGYLVKGTRGAVTASAMLGSLQSASQSFSSNVAERVKNGESIEAASDAELLPSIASGVITGAVTKGFGSTGIERIWRQGGGKAVMSKLRETIVGAGGEMAEEVADEAGQIINDLTFGKDVDREEIIKRVGIAAVVAGMLGGGVNALHASLAPKAEVDPAAAAIAADLRKSGAPQTAEVIESENRAAVVRAAEAPATTVMTEVTPQPPDIRLATRQEADGTYKHEFSIPDTATVEQLEAFKSKLNISFLPPEAVTAITTQLDAEIARKGGAGASPASPAVSETSGASTEPAASPAQLQEAAGPRIVSTAIRDSAKPENVVRGDEWNTGHDEFTLKAIEGGIEADTLERGFIIRDSDGTERFVSRQEAAPIAIASGQAAEGVTKLRSQDLIEQAVAAQQAEREGPMTATRAVVAPEGESLAPAPAARPLPEPARPPSVAAAAKAAAIPRTDEEKIAKVEAGREEGLQAVLETGIVPPQNVLHRMTGSSTAASQLLKELRARVATEFPPETVAEGSRQTEMTNPLTGSKLPSSIDADGKVRPLFTNDPHLTAQQVDLGIASTSPASRLYIPDEIATSGKVNPAIRYAKEKGTGKYYVIGADAILPDGDILPVNGPDELTKPYQAAQRLSGMAQKPLGLDPTTLQQVATAVEKGLSERKLDFGPLEFHLEDSVDPGEAAPAEGEQRVAIQGQTNQIPVTGDGLTQTILGNVDSLAKIGLGKGSPGNPIAGALKQISTSNSVPANVRVLAKQLLKAPIDWNKVRLSFFTRPDEGAAGYYTNGARVEHGHIQINLGATHVGSAITTLLHEAVHHGTMLKLADNYARSSTEQKAYNQIRAAYDKVLADVFEQETGKKGSPEELKKFAKKQGGDKRIVNYNQNSVFYGLTDLREFVAESLSSARFQRFLSSFEAPKGEVKGKIGNVLNAMRNALKQLFTGQEIKKGSLLDQALEGSFGLLKEPTRQESIGRGKGTSSELRSRSREDVRNMGRFDLEDYAIEMGELDADAVRSMTKPEILVALGFGDKPAMTGTGPIKSGTIGARPYGWLEPNGKFVEVEDLGHDNVAREIIQGNPKLAAAFEKAVKKDPSLASPETSGENLTNFMIVNGFVRLAGDVDTTIYIQGKPTASQARILRDAAIEKGVSLINDRGGRSQVLYRPDEVLAQQAAPKPGLVHTIGADGKVVHSVDLPDTATDAQVQELVDAISKSRLSDAEKTRLTQEVQAQAAANASKATAVANAISPAAASGPSGSGFFDMISKTVRKYMTAEGHLPKDVFHRWQEREGEVKAISREASYILRDLYKGVQKEFGISGGSRLVKGLSDVPPEFVKKMNDALLGKVSMSALPETVRGPLQEMRAQIDNLSQQFIDAGLVDGDLAAQFKDNLGTYMTRSYRAYDDPNWPDNIPTEVRNTARAFFLSELKADNPNATEADADRLMASLLQDWKEQGDTRGVQPGRGPKLGAVNKTIFMKRGDIPPEVRAFMGEHEDPAINFMRSVTKMANTMANTRFLADVRQKGMGKLLFEDGKQPDGFSSQIAAEGSQMMAPLNGLRTTPEIAEAFREFGKAADPGSAPFRFWMKIAAAAKGAKTVGSLMTQIRNAQQFWFFGMNGHYDMTKVREAFKSTSADIGLSDSPQWRAFYTKMTKLGVVNQSTHAGELRDTINEALLPTESSSEFSGPGKTTMKGIRNVVKAPFDMAARAYQISDDMGKVIGFLNERARQETQHPDWTPEQVDTEAAQRIRLTYPSYSMVPEAVKITRRQPVFGPFMTFGYETLRTTYHNLRFTAEAIKNARTATDPEIAKAYRTEAAQRMAGQLAVLGGAGLAASLVSRALTGLRKEEENDARKFLPEWDRNSQLLFTGKENGKLDYVNISYSNPYSIIPDTVGAITRGITDEKSIVSTIANATKEFLSPYISENILASATIDIMRNKRATNGRPVYNEGDTADQKARAILDRFYESLEPGTLTRLRTKVLPAARGETRRGQELSVARELTSEFTGFKAQKMNFRESLGYKGSDFARTLRETDDILRQTFLREGNVSTKEILDTYTRSEGQRFAMFRELHDVAMASIRRGVPPSEVRTILRKRGNVAKEIVSAVIADRYKPQDISKETRKRLREMKRVLPPMTSPYKGRSLSGERKPTPLTPVEPQR